MGGVKKEKLKFERIISIGFFCGGALELEKMGFRDKSYPFDWVISDIYSINELLANDFQDLFDKDLLYRTAEYPSIVYHKKYKFDFYHDFDRTQSIESQVEKIESKYRRRINNFYTSIKKPTLFIRYILDDEVPYWYQKDNELINRLTKENKNSYILLIANRGVEINSDKLPEGVFAVFKVDPDANDIVSRNFLADNDQFRKLLNSIQYPVNQKARNHYAFFTKKIKKKMNGLQTRICTILQKAGFLSGIRKLVISKTTKTN